MFSISPGDSLIDGKIVYPRTTEVNFKNRYFIDDQYSLTTTDNEDDSNSSLSLNPNTPVNNQSSPSVQQYDECLTTTNKTFSELFLNNIPKAQAIISVNESKLNTTTTTTAAAAVVAQNKQQQQNFLTNYELPQVKQQIDGGGKIKQNKSKQSKNNKNSTQNLNPSSNSSTSGGGSTKKVSQLIFHEYRGPNKKSSVSRSSINSDSSIKENELSSYKIRLEQQKMFLQFDEQSAPPQTQQQQQSQQSSSKGQQSQQTVSQIQILPKLQPPPQQQQQQQQHQTMMQNSQHVSQQQAIQYVPLQIHPDTLKNLFNSQILSIAALGAANNIQQPQQLQQQQQQQQILQQVLNLQPVLQQQQQTVQVASNQLAPESSKTQAKIDEMTMNELKDECRRRRLHVTGNKQKLIERLKTNTNNVKPVHNDQSNKQTNGSQDQVQTLQFVKSPDSGVNMDSSPGIPSSMHMSKQVKVFKST